jgi:hypothetical protein
LPPTGNRSPRGKPSSRAAASAAAKPRLGSPAWPSARNAAPRGGARVCGEAESSDGRKVADSIQKVSGIFVAVILQTACHGFVNGK